MMIKGNEMPKRCENKNKMLGAAKNWVVSWLVLELEKKGSGRQRVMTCLIIPFASSEWTKFHFTEFTEKTKKTTNK